MVMTATIFASIAIMGPVFLTHVQAATQITGCPNISRNLSFGINGAGRAVLAAILYSARCPWQRVRDRIFWYENACGRNPVPEANDLPAFGFAAL